MPRETHIGFTGTGHRPLTASQRASLWDVLEEAFQQGYRTFHHGDCIHGDAEAHEVAYGIGFAIEIHPPLNEYKRAHMARKTNDPARVKLHLAKDFIPRNHDIVNASSRMIACPKEDHEIVRSGTWATVRYAHNHGVPVEIIYP